MASLGGVCGLTMVGAVYTALGSHGHAISLLALAFCLIYLSWPWPFQKPVAVPWRRLLQSADDRQPVLPPARVRG